MIKNESVETTKKGRKVRERTEYHRLTLKNDFMFSKVMQDKELCIELLRRILPELDIRSIEDVDAQKYLKHYYENKGSRLDIYATDQNGRRYDIEMQVDDVANLPRRARYYSSMMDANDLLAGQEYDTVAVSYVIFICTKDPFELNQHMYEFRNICMTNPEVQLDDGSVKIFLNTKGTVGEISPELRSFLKYLEGERLSEKDPYLDRLEKAVDRARQNEDWRTEYMFLKDIQRDSFVRGERAGKEEGRAEGRAEGLEEGRAEGEARIQKKAGDEIQKLLDDGLISKEAAERLQKSIDTVD